MSSTSSIRQIKASAGSGKTFALTSSFLELLGQSQAQAKLRVCSLNPSQAWSEILAVTFTNRAATEMQERILGRLKDLALKDLANKTPDLRDLVNSDLTNKALGPKDLAANSKASLWLDIILRNFSSLNVRTIDSLLHTLVRLGALQLHLPPDFKPVFNLQEALEPLLDEILIPYQDAAAKQLMPTPNSAWVPDLTSSPSKLKPANQNLLEAACYQIFKHSAKPSFLLGNSLRPAVLDMVKAVLNEGHPQATSTELEALLLAWLANTHHLALQLQEDLEEEKLKAHQNLKKALAKCLIGSSPSLKQFQDLPLDSVMLQKADLSVCLNKGSAPASAQAASTYLTLCVQLRQLRTDGKKIRKALELMPFLGLADQVVSQLPNYLRTSGYLPADFVPHFVKQILSNGVSEALCRLGTRLTHILIDEFQDTSTDQWLALKPLLIEALAKGGSLTFVGDVKQAIYGWRGGDCSLFNEVLNDADLKPLAPKPKLESLANNWRSCAAIVQSNNTLFSQLQDLERTQEILFAMLPKKLEPEDEVAINLAIAEGLPLVQATFQNCVQREATDHSGCFKVEILADAEEETLQAFLDLVQKLSQHHAYADLTILVRSNAKATIAANWLLQAGLPVVTENSFLLAEHPVIVELMALLNFLAYPTDALSLAVFLKGQYICPLLEELPPQTVQAWLQTPHENLLPEFKTSFPKLWLQLQPFATVATAYSTYDLVQEIIQAWQLESKLPFATTFLRRLLEIIHLATTPKGQSHALGSFLSYWQNHGQTEKAPMPENLNAVRIMTIHKAKGLQFPVVIVPWHDFELKPRPKIVACEVEGLRFLTQSSKAFGLDYYREWMANVRESLHLLYVAWTRAECEFYGFVQQDTGFIQGLLQFLSNTNHCLGQARTKKLIPKAPTPIKPWQPVPAPAFSSMPRLKVFRNPLRTYQLSQERRGTFVHQALELLQGLLLRHTPDLAAELALQQALTSFPLPVTAPQIILDEILQILQWYAKLPQAKTWSIYGNSEQELVNAQGKAFRADLIVNTGKYLEIIDYKTGKPTPEQKQAHLTQITNYLTLAQASQRLPVMGYLVYLDRQEICNVTIKI